MKYFILIALFILVSSAHAQKDSMYTYDQLFEQNTEMIEPPYFGAGGGFMTQFMQIKFDHFNGKNGPEDTHKKLNLDQMSDGLLLTGGGGYTALPFINGLRIGGMGMGGSKTVSKSGIHDPSLGADSIVDRSFQYSLNYGAASIEYVVRFHSLGKLHIVPGVLLGGGSVKLTFIQRSALTLDCYDVISPKQKSEQQQIVSSSLLTYQPYLNFEYAVLPYLGLRAGVGYNGALMSGWKHNGSEENLSDSQEITEYYSPKSLYFNGGIFLGIFP